MTADRIRAGPPKTASAEVVRHITCTLCEALCALEVRLDADGSIASIRGHGPTRSRGATSAPRPSPSRTSTRTRTGSAARRPDGEGLARGAVGRRHPVRRRAAGRRAARARGRRRRGLPRQPQRPQPRCADAPPDAGAAARTRNRFSATSVDQCPTRSSRGRSTATSSSCPCPTSTAPTSSCSSATTRWRRTARCGPSPTSRGDVAGSPLAEGDSSCSIRVAPRPPRSPTSTTSSAPAPTRRSCSPSCASC